MSARLPLLGASEHKGSEHDRPVHDRLDHDFDVHDHQCAGPVW